MLDTIIGALSCPGLQEIAFKLIVIVVLILHSMRLRRIEGLRSIKDFLNDK